MIRVLAVLAVGGCWTGSSPPAPTPPESTPPVLAPGAAYAQLFVPGPLTFPATLDIRRRTTTKTTSQPIRCEISVPERDRSVLVCPGEVRLPDWVFVRDERGLWLDDGGEPVHLMQSVPKRALLSQGPGVWDIEVRVRFHAGAWCTHHAWSGESTVGSWSLCLRDGALVGATYTVARDDGTETVTFGESTP